MKLLRIWLLVLLAVLLPVRGAMAAAMACPPPASAPVQQLGADAGGHGHGNHGHDEAGHAQGADNAAADHAHAAGPADKCNMCSASCATPPVPSAARGLATPLDLASASFPDLRAPAPTFQSDGQDRPPRTI
ncbi:hypothetical protein LJR039_000214 [Pseudorhodoferax sp. LjRoot39]|uniref:hypothetical protein n=1 Tax=Pseudorhodoferax sp. LjRoot39 TaxID=3342328 RepID=UPI003ECE6495